LAQPKMAHPSPPKTRRYRGTQPRYQWLDLELLCRGAMALNGLICR